MVCFALRKVFRRLFSISATLNASFLATFCQRAPRPIMSILSDQDNPKNGEYDETGTLAEVPTPFFGAEIEGPGFDLPR